MTAQGHPRTIFRRAIERGNLLVAQTEARAMGRVTLSEALELTLLVARKDPKRLSGFATRLLVRLVEEQRLSIEQTSMAAASLAALGGDGHDAACATLYALVERC